MVYALVKKPEQQVHSVMAFGFEFERQPGAWRGRRTISVGGEGDKRESVVETANAWAKANGSGLFLMVTRYDGNGKRLWNVSIDFTMQGKFVNAQSKVDESVWRAPGRESNEILEKEMAKLMTDPLMKEDIKKAVGEREKKSAIAQQFARIPKKREEIIKKIFDMTPHEEQLVTKLKEGIITDRREYESFIKETADAVESIFGIPKTLDETREVIRKIFGKDEPVIAVNVFDFLKSKKK